MFEPIAVLPEPEAFAPRPPAVASVPPLELAPIPNCCPAIAGVAMPRVSAEISAIDRDLKPDLVLT